MKAVFYLFVNVCRQPVFFPAMFCDKYMEEEKMRIVMYLFTMCSKARFWQF